MGSVFAEQQHKFHPSHHLLSTLLGDSNTNIDIPPRKLLTHHTQDFPSTHDIYSPRPAADYSPRFSSADEAHLLKFLPYNTGVDHSDSDHGSDPYSSDHFRMFEFKVRRCTRSRSHDWTDCPFAHPGEKARRRDPRRHHYSGTVCADYRRGSCSRGDSCEFAHGVFECWLHPARYRTEACKDGKNCKRKVCFFGHTPRQLRVLPVQSSADDQAVLSPMASKKKHHLNKHCCLFYHSAGTTSSPTSTLLGMSHLSPPMSPPLSPAGKNCSSVNGFHSSPLSQYSRTDCRHSHLFSGSGSGGGLGLDQMHASAGEMMSYEDVLAELMSSLEAMKFNEASSSPMISSPINNSAAAAAGSPNAQRWVDVSFNMNSADHHDHDQQQQFILSPMSSAAPSPSGGPGNFINWDTIENCSSRKKSSLGLDDNYKLKINNEIIDGGGSGSSDPDFGWVNDLLM